MVGLGVLLAVGLLLFGLTHGFDAGVIVGIIGGLGIAVWQGRNLIQKDEEEEESEEW